MTKLDHDANVAPWLELQHDLGIVVRFVEVTDDLALDYDDLARQLSERTRVVAFPVAANSVGTAARRAPRRRPRPLGGRTRLGRCSPLRPARPDRRRRLGRRRADLLAVQVLRPASRAGLRQARPARGLAAVQGAAGGERAGRAPASSSGRCSTSCSRASSQPSTTSTRSAGRRSRATSASWGSGSSPGCPLAIRLHGLPTMTGRVPTFCFDVPGLSPEETAERLAERDLAVWWGNYYALETMKRLGLDPGAGRGPRRNRPLQHGRRSRPAASGPARLRSLSPSRGPACAAGRSTTEDRARR